MSFLPLSVILRPFCEEEAISSENAEALYQDGTLVFQQLRSGDGELFLIICPFLENECNLIPPSFPHQVAMKFQTGALLSSWSFWTTVLSQELVTVPWKTGRSVVDGLIEQLTPEEKISLLHGGYDPNTGSQGQNQAGYVNPIPRLGIPQFRLSDGENGLNLVDDATGIPSQLNVAASFSRDVAFKHGSVAGSEAKVLGMGMLFDILTVSFGSVNFNLGTVLAPRLNILRDVVSGAFWQSYSEDPYLTSQMGLQAMAGIQSHGTMANAKQLAASSTGASNGDSNSIVGLQTLHEVYLPGYEYVLKAGVATIMCSYVAVSLRKLSTFALLNPRIDQRCTILPKYRIDSQHRPWRLELHWHNHVRLGGNS
jgi:beta-glucosidase